MQLNKRIEQIKKILLFPILYQIILWISNLMKPIGYTMGENQFMNKVLQKKGKRL